MEVARTLAARRRHSPPLSSRDTPAGFARSKPKIHGMRIRRASTADRAMNAEASVPGRKAPAGSPRNPHLGRQLFGYSHAKTHVLLDQVASSIEDLSRQLAAEQASRVALEAELTSRDASLEKLASDLEAVRGSLVQAERKVIDVGDVMITAHRLAADIEGAARREATVLLEAARNEAVMIIDEAHLVMDESETRARAVAEEAEAEAETVRAESDRLKAFVENEQAAWQAFLARAGTAARALSEVPPVSSQRPAVEAEPPGAAGACRPRGANVDLQDQSLQRA